MAENGFNFMALLNPQFAAQQQQFALQQAMAQQMMQEGGQQEPTAQLANPGGQVVANSPIGGLARGLEKGLGAYLAKKNIDDQMAAYQKMGEAGTGQQMGNIMSLAQKGTVTGDPQMDMMFLMTQPGDYMKSLATAHAPTDLMKNMGNPNTAAIAGAERFKAGPGGALIDTSTLGGGGRQSTPAPSTTISPDNAAKMNELYPPDTEVPTQTNVMPNPIAGMTPNVSSVNPNDPAAVAGKTEGAKAAAAGSVKQMLEVDQPEAKAAKLTLDAISNAKDAISRGMITGAGAEEKLSALKGLKAIGMLPQDFDESIANTETFKSSMGSLVMNQIKSLGSGTGISDADREFTKDIVGGKVALDEKSFPRILDIQEKTARYKIDHFNKGVDSYEKNVGKKLDYDPRIEMPSVSSFAPSSATLTPAEQAELDGLRKRFAK